MKDFNIYLTFDGNAREAMTFYKDCLGAELDLKSFGDFPEQCPGVPADRIMHARLSVGSAVIMASDSMPGMPYTQGNSFSINIDCETMEETKDLFAAYSEGATVVMPLQDMFWGAYWGLLTDKFGVSWMFNFTKPTEV